MFSPTRNAATKAPTRIIAPTRTQRIRRKRRSIANLARTKGDDESAAASSAVKTAAKAAFVGGISAGLAALERIGVEGVLVAEGGAVHPTPGFGRFLAGAATVPMRVP